MKLYRNNWYYIGGILFVVLSFVMGFFGNHVSPIQLILVTSFMALLVHQFEEYVLPGGFDQNQLWDLRPSLEPESTSGGENPARLASMRLLGAFPNK
jgi:hypothetical protein